MLIGYARVSTDDQDLRLQRAALKDAGCKRTFEEKVSGAKRDRPELARMIEQLRDDDTVVVTRLDRLARSTRDLLDIAEKLKEVGAGLRSLAEPWADTTSPAGRMVLTVFAGIAEFERELIHQRTSSGRVAAKARGVRFGRPPKLTPDQIALGERLVGEGTSVREAAKLLKCHHATLYRALADPYVDRRGVLFRPRLNAEAHRGIRRCKGRLHAGPHHISAPNGRRGRDGRDGAPYGKPGADDGRASAEQKRAPRLRSRRQR